MGITVGGVGFVENRRIRHERSVLEAEESED
jgi:hypothetical protein